MTTEFLLTSHLVTAACVVILFLVQSYFVWQNMSLPKAVKICGHISYAIVIGLGGYLLWTTFGTAIPHWLWAKLVLFYVALSATFKSKKASATLIQRKAGIIVALVAYISLTVLAWVRPVIDMAQ